MDAIYSKSIKAGQFTYFIDVKKAKNKSKYLTIAQSSPSKDDESKFKRSCIMVFDSQVENFRDAIDEAVGVIQL